MPLSEDEELELLLLEQEERARRPKAPDAGRKQRANEARQNAARASVEAEDILNGPSWRDALESGLVAATDNLSMGWGDEGAGIWNAIKNPSDLKGAYLQGRDERRALTRDAQELAPQGYATGDLAATLGSAIIPGAKVATAPTALRAAGRGAALGAATGGVAGVGGAEGGVLDQLEQGLWGAGGGSLLGFGLGGVGHKAGTYLGSKFGLSKDAPPPTAPTPDAARAPPRSASLREKAMAVAKAFVPDRFKKAAGNIQSLDELAAIERARGGFQPDPVAAGLDDMPRGSGPVRGSGGTPDAPWLDPDFNQMRPPVSPDNMVVEPLAASAQLDDLEKSLADTVVRHRPEPSGGGAPRPPTPPAPEPSGNWSMSADDIRSLEDPYDLIRAIPDEKVKKAFANLKEPTVKLDASEVKAVGADDVLFPDQPAAQPEGSVVKEPTVSGRPPKSTPPPAPAPEPPTPTQVIRGAVQRRAELEGQRESMGEEAYNAARRSLAMERKKAGPDLLMRKGPEGAIRWVLENGNPANEKEAAAMAGLPIKKFRELSEKFGIDTDHLRKPDLGRHTPKKKP